MKVLMHWVRNRSCGRINLYVYEPQQNLGRGLRAHKTGLSLPVIYFLTTPKWLSVILYSYCHCSSARCLSLTLCFLCLGKPMSTCWETAVHLAFHLCFYTLSQLMRLDCSTYHIGDQRRLRRACASAQSARASLFAHMKYGSRQRVPPPKKKKKKKKKKIKHLAPLGGCASAFEEWVHGGQKVP